MPTVAVGILLGGCAPTAHSPEPVEVVLAPPRPSTAATSASAPPAASANAPPIASRGWNGAPGTYPIVSGGRSCEAAQSAYAEAYNAQGMPPDIGALDGRAVLSNGNYLKACGVPASIGVDICVAVQNGASIGATVQTHPPNVGMAGCIACAAGNLCETEVEQAHPTLLDASFAIEPGTPAKRDVRRLDVAVDAGLVHEDERPQDLGGDEHRVADREPTDARQFIREVEAFEMLEDEERRSVGQQVRVVEVGDVRVAHEKVRSASTRNRSINGVLSARVREVCPGACDARAAAMGLALWWVSRTPNASATFRR